MKIECDEIEVEESHTDGFINIWQAGEMVLVSKEGSKELIKILQEWVLNNG